ncbi:YdiU family protein [Sulfurovum sp. zt1-1]|uniref:Protein nucleotidyltransferase YdiU n=1 Tax=Sulfurovum zhangzhouensis TaxID=3019067 RepID=A0ABT7QVX2_9BACT|nr:YdiU family protein [Sulfurovum zhangzhouensis]MDM5270990.1 YdiU family protein [Sulfurovum zhangzhouensis]
MKLKEIQLTNPYLELPALCYDRVKPSPLQSAYLIHANPEIAEQLDIDQDELDTEHFVEFVNGALELEGSDPFAMCYAGHQFGFFVERLGDGRAVNIGTIATPMGNQHLQLKGAGLTKYSRDGDGRAVLRSSIREYLMSEAMNGLGIPTTRALALIGSGHSVYRGEWEKGAIVLRVSPSWVRFGTFEYFAHHKKYVELKALADYAIAESYPHLIGEENVYELFFTEVVGKTAMLMAQWQAVGFNHGVMNTDNMSIHGLTIDYGPYAFLDDYDFRNICNHTDTYGRYSFGSQPNIGEWNLRALMVALSPLADEERMSQILDKHYARLYTQHYLYRMGKKLGLDKLEQDDIDLVSHLLGMMQGLSVDYTLFFRTLSHYNGDRKEILKVGLYHQPMHDWLDAYDERLTQNTSTTEERHQNMQRTNPKYVLKNYMLQEAITAANQGDFSIVDQLFKLAQSPYDEHPECERWAGATPEEFKNKKLSCSS